MNFSERREAEVHVVMNARIGPVRSARIRGPGVRNGPGAQYNPPLGRRQPHLEDSNDVIQHLLPRSAAFLRRENSQEVRSVASRNRLQRFLVTTVAC